MFQAHELRLLHALLLNPILLWTCWRIVRALPGPSCALDNAIDLILGFAASAGTIILALGWVGSLSVLSVTAVVLAAAVTVRLPVFRPRTPPQARPAFKDDGAGFTAPTVVAVCAVGLVLAAVFIARTTPALATDALIYHLALPGRWIQEGRIEVIPLWFHNPANSYSPLHASCLFAWWMLPMGNDVLARFGQMPFLLLCGLCIYRLLRRAEVAPFVAAAAGAACCVSRPFLAEALQTKDDVILTAYVLAAVVALTDEQSDPLRAAIRGGLSTGLLLATKYTAVLSLPILLLLIVCRLWRRSWGRSWLWAIPPLLVMAGPWYVRNLVTTGNPIFPIEVRLGSWTVLQGIFATAVAPADRSLRSLLHVLVGPSRFTLPPALMLAVTLAWALGWVVLRKRWRHPTILAFLSAPPLLVLVFYLISPFREVRFLFPAIALTFAAAGASIGNLPGAAWVRWMAAATVAAISIATSMPMLILKDAVAIGGAVAAVFLLGGLVWRRWLADRRDLSLVGAALLVSGAAMWVYVDWGVYVERCRLDYRFLWAQAYSADGLGPAWDWIDRHASPDDIIAYTGTPMIYPLMGFDLNRRVVYIPIRRGIDDFAHLPRISSQPLAGSEIITRTVETYRKTPDRTWWLTGLSRRGVRYLLVISPGGQPEIESQWAQADSNFRLAFRSGSTNVYAVNSSALAKPA
jgi:hypothetical protein